jgi:3',5'-cyclic AMP phosphodiesterase CpdA
VSPTAAVFAIEDDAAQIIVRDGHDVRAVDVHGLVANTTQEVAVEGQRLSVTTLAPPPGARLSRVATLSDLHLGVTHHFGIREDDAALTPFALRCARAAVAEALAWGADAIVFKGDLTQHARRDEWEQLGALLDEIPVPVGVLIGNHDLRHAPGADDARKALASLGRPFSEVTSIDLPGARIVLADSTVAGREIGGLDRVRADAVSQVASASGPAIVMVHHHLEGAPVPIGYPIGVPRGSAGRFVRALRDANPAIFITSGHSHRNRARTLHGVPVTQVGSVKDYPGVWAGYAIHEGGVRQVVRRVAAPDCLAWTERTAEALHGLWGRWTRGRLADRCLVHVWPPRG